MLKSKTFPVGPLFDSLHAFREDSKQPHPVPNERLLKEISGRLPEAISDFKQASRFLLNYSRKSEATFNRFRNEIERFLLWSWTYPEKSVINLKRSDIDDYIDFCWMPDEDWISTEIVPRFQLDQGVRFPNLLWRPFMIKATKSQRSLSRITEVHISLDKSHYAISQSTLLSIFTALNVFYKDLLLEEYAQVNFVPIVKKRCPYLINNVKQQEVQRLSELQWEFVLETAKMMADEDNKFERHLFLIAALKSLYLRISELAIRNSPVSGTPEWIPVMSHFYSKEGFWFLEVFGKGRKARVVTVPEAFLVYLKRYRSSRNLPGLPTRGENQPIISKLKGHGAMTSRQLTRFVQAVFDKAIEKMKAEGFDDQAEELRSATTHWLRHTGASLDVNSRPLKHLADDLGHASMGTTDKIYIQSDLRERARSGAKRKV